MEQKIETSTWDQDVVTMSRVELEDTVAILRLVAVEKAFASKSALDLKDAEIERLHLLVREARELATSYAALAQEVRLIAKEAATPDGEGVAAPALLWAKEWARRLTAAEFKGSEDPKCVDAGEACIDCLCIGCCMKMPNVQITGGL